MINTAEDVWQTLADQELCSPEQLAQLQSQYAQGGPSDAGSPLLEWLVLEGAFSAYQAAVLEGSTDGPLKLGPYDLLELIPDGRLKGIYRARHARLQFPVCVKVLRPIGTPVEVEAQLTRFQREARVSVQVDHPNTVRTYQVGHADGLYFIAFEDLRGQTLGEVLDADSVLAEGDYPYAERLWNDLQTHTRPAEVCRLIRETALGLAHLHAQGIVHRDVRPHNIWIMNDARVKLMDFGLARDALAYLDPSNADEQTAGPEGFLGSTSYVSLEQALDPESATGLSDVYSLGCTAYHALAGQVPFAASSPAKQLLHHAMKSPPPPSQLNEEVVPQLDEVVAGMMAKNPEDRYQSAATVAEVLEHFIHPEDHVTYEEAQTPQLFEFLRWISEDAPIYVPYPTHHATPREDNGDRVRYTRVEDLKDDSVYTGWKIKPVEVKKVLFPTDFSKLSDAALAQAMSLARDSSATLLIVHVEEPPSAYSAGEMYYGVPDPDNNALRTMLKGVVPPDKDLKTEYHLLTGDPATEIVRLAEKENVDLIVMGTHGRTGLTRFLIGGTAEQVVRRAPCAVLTVKLPHQRRG